MGDEDVISNLISSALSELCFVDELGSLLDTFLLLLKYNSIEGLKLVHQSTTMLKSNKQNSCRL